MLIQDNEVGACRCVARLPLIIICRDSITCGHCGHVVYPDAMVFRAHRLTCLNTGAALWWSKDMRVEVHRCKVEAFVSTEEELASLAAHQPAAPAPWMPMPRWPAL